MQNSQTVSLHLRLKQLLSANRFTECESLARRRVQLSPADSVAWKYLADSIFRQGRVRDALKPATRSVQLRPEDVRCELMLAEIYFSLEEWPQAIPIFRSALSKLEKEPSKEIGPIHQAAYFNKLGHALFNMGEIVAAQSAFLVAAARNPQSTQAWFNLGVCYAELGELNEAETPFRNALVLDPSDIKHLATLGTCLLSLERWAEAFEYLEQAHAKDPGDLSVRNNLGVSAQKTGKLALAKTLMSSVVESTPDKVNAWVNLGNIHRDGKDLVEAKSAYEKALAIDPANFSGLTALAMLHFQTQQIDVAEKLMLRAVELPSNSHPSFFEIYSDVGSIYSTQARHQEAESWYRRGLEALPKNRLVWHKWLFAVNNNPFFSSEKIKAEFDAFAENFEGSSQQVKVRRTRRAGAQKVRVGYVSADFNVHSVRHFLLPLLRNHDAHKFEVYALTNMADTSSIWDPYKEVVKNWKSVYGLSAPDAAQLIEDLEIDVLVDLSGHTAGNRLDIFSRHPAPVSVSWMGFGSTTGLRSIDYYLTDEKFVPYGDEVFFSEKPWRLPRTAFAYMPAENMGPVGGSSFEANGFVTFVNLSRVIRFNDALVAAWAEILKRVPDSILRIDCKNMLDQELVRRTLTDFAKNGIDPSRLKLGYESPPWDVLRSSDIYLDCFPHNSGTTLFESLYMGVPFVTLSSRPGVGRLGGAILDAAGHPEWTAFSTQEYIEKAVALARDRDGLSLVRSKLRSEIDNGDLRNEAEFCKAVEQAYVDMLALVDH